MYNNNNINTSSQQPASKWLVLGACLVATCALAQLTHCAPTTTTASSSLGPQPASSSTRRPNLFLSLFRRQVSNAQVEDSDSTESSSAAADEEGSETEMMPIEMEAQKFLETIPGYSNNKDNEPKEPTSFRERMSDTFGLLRDGWSNQFKALRENFSDTVEEIRDTWSGSQQD